MDSSRVDFLFSRAHSRNTKGGVRGTRRRQPIEEEQRAGQPRSSRCACTRSRVYRGIKEGAVALVRSLVRLPQREGR